MNCDSVSVVGGNLGAPSNTNPVTNHKIINWMIASASRPGFADVSFAYVYGHMMPLRMHCGVVQLRLCGDYSMLPAIPPYSGKQKKIAGAPQRTIRNEAEFSDAWRELLGRPLGRVIWVWFRGTRRQVRIKNEHLHSAAVQILLDLRRPP